MVNCFRATSQDQWSSSLFKKLWLKVYNYDHLIVIFKTFCNFSTSFVFVWFVFQYAPLYLLYQLNNRWNLFVCIWLLLLISLFCFWFGQYLILKWYFCENSVIAVNLDECALVQRDLSSRATSLCLGKPSFLSSPGVVTVP